MPIAVMLVLLTDNLIGAGRRAKRLRIRSAKVVPILPYEKLCFAMSVGAR